MERYREREERGLDKKEMIKDKKWRDKEKKRRGRDNEQYRKGLRARYQRKERGDNNVTDKEE